MQENDRNPNNDGFNPLSICHRLFNFIMNSFLTRGTKRVTLGITTNAAPARALEQGSSQDHVVRPDGHGPPGPEMLVEFRHTNGATVLKQRNKGLDQVSVRENEGDGIGNGENVMKKLDLIIRDGANNLPGRRHHLLSVASNINEKADAFIRSRKEAMEKNLSLKQIADI